MTALPVYLDSSALIKLVFEEAESSALQRFLRNWPRRACSVVGQVEMRRIARRVGDVLVDHHARDVVSRLELIGVDHSIVRHAIDLEPRTLRSHDAIHLATALSLTPHVAGMVVYDRRLAEAADAAGLRTWAPA